nr:hypothetical protein [uncultured Oscillibacter sp.]
MKKKTILRIISLAMLVIAAVFVIFALNCPQCGRTVSIGNFRFGAEQWIICYKLYVLVMVSLFAGSFWVRER